MNQPRVGLVGVTCKYESGGQRAEELLSGIKDALKKEKSGCSMCRKSSMGFCRCY